MVEVEASSSSSGSAKMMTMVVGVDDSEPSWNALQWTLHHFFQPPPPHRYHLVVINAKPAAACNVGLAGPGAADVVSLVEADLKRSAMRVIHKAKDFCAQMQVSDAAFECWKATPGTCSARPWRSTAPSCSSSATMATA